MYTSTGIGIRLVCQSVLFPSLNNHHTSRCLQPGIGLSFSIVLGFLDLLDEFCKNPLKVDTKDQLTFPFG